MDIPNPGRPDIDFKELVDEFYAPLYRFGYSLAGNEYDASDLTQQTFFIWAKKGSTLRDATKVKSWLFTTLYREFLRIRRRSNQSISVEPEALDSEMPPVLPDMVTILDSAGAVEMLQELDDIYKAPIVLFYLEDLSYKEIAAALDLPIGTVMSRLSRGKAHLKNSILKKERNKTPSSDSSK